MRSWDPGSFVVDDDELPSGWGDDSPPGTPPEQQGSAPDRASSCAPSCGDGCGVGGDGAAVPTPSVAPRPTLRARSPRGPEVDPSAVALPWASKPLRSVPRRELPSLFTNVPEQLGDLKGRPPRPPAPQSRMPFSVDEAALAHARGRRLASEAPVAVAMAAAAADSGAADGVRVALHLLKRQKRHASLEETLEGLEALQKMQRHLLEPTELPPLPVGRRSCRLEKLRAASAHVPRRRRDGARTEGRPASPSRMGRLPELPRRSASVPLEPRRAGLPAL